MQMTNTEFLEYLKYELERLSGPITVTAFEHAELDIRITNKSAETQGRMQNLKNHNKKIDNTVDDLITQIDQRILKMNKEE
jgi:hypothetical protein